MHNIPVMVKVPKSIYFLIFFSNSELFSLRKHRQVFFPVSKEIYSNQKNQNWYINNAITPLPFLSGASFPAHRKEENKKWIKGEMARWDLFPVCP